MQSLRRVLYSVIMIGVFCFAEACEAFAQRRVALVIGNSEYSHTARLSNPRNDAMDISAVLKRLQFQVIEGFDLDKPAMERAIRDFAETLAGSQLSLFFYAGHGLQVGGQNYLVPVDAKLASGAALDFETVRLDLVQRTMERESRSNILILDACRDNPLARNLARSLGTRSGSIGRGLASMESGDGTLISFSTQPGNVAFDGDGRNSPFAAALLKHIPTPGEDLPSILINVRNDVMTATERRQVPWEHSALTAKVYFIPPKPSGPTIEQQVELSFWESIKDIQSTNVLRSYLDRYPTGAFAATAQALIEHYEEKAKAEAAERAEIERRRDEALKTAQLERLEADRRAKEAEAESERRRALELKDSTAARIAEERARAEARERDELLRKALEEVAAARDAARTAVDNHAVAIKAAEEARQRAESAIKAQSDPTKSAVAQDVATLASPVAARDPKAEASPTKVDLALQLNRELARVGCNPGVVGQSWTSSGQKALRQFASIAKRALHFDQPTAEALEAVASHKSLVCPPATMPQLPSRSRGASERPSTKKCRRETVLECTNGGRMPRQLCAAKSQRKLICS